MDVGLSDFLNQPGVQRLLLITFVAGVLYIGSMAYVLRRGQLRRQRRRMAAMESAQQDQTTQIQDIKLASMDLFAPTSSLLPEPDLDFLAPPPSLSNAFAQPSTSPAVSPAEPPTALSVYSQENSIMDSNPNPNQAAPVEIGDAIEVMRVLRDINDGTLIIQMDGKNYRSMTDIQNPDLSRRFAAVVRDLWTMVSRGGGGVLPVVAAAMTGDLPQPKASVNTRLGRLATEEEKPKPHMLKQMAQQVMGTADKPSEAPQRTIADVVEEFLQFKLLSNPQFASRNIHIRPAANHGIKIEVDDHFYEGVGDVVDVEVREFLMATMREWEARQ